MNLLIFIGILLFIIGIILLLRKEIWKAIKPVFLFITELFKKKSKIRREIEQIEFNIYPKKGIPNPFYVPEKNVTPDQVNMKKIKKFSNLVLRYNQITGGHNEFTYSNI